jgi:hypothetical protein
MKEYRLSAWPELAAPYDRTAFRRMLNDMSHRHVSVAQLKQISGLRRHDVRSFVKMLDRRGLLETRDRASGTHLISWLRQVLWLAPKAR